jgi:hypothetical protein
MVYKHTKSQSSERPPRKLENICVTLLFNRKQNYIQSQHLIEFIRWILSKDTLDNQNKLYTTQNMLSWCSNRMTHIRFEVVVAVNMMTVWMSHHVAGSNMLTLWGNLQPRVWRWTQQVTLKCRYKPQYMVPHHTGHKHKWNILMCVSPCIF